MNRKNWLKKKSRLKYKIRQTTNDHKLVIFRSNKHIYGQIVNINDGVTIVSSSSIDKNIIKDLKKLDNGKIEISKVVARNLSDKMKKSKITDITFDRNGYRYHGRVKAFADELRNNGIKF
tara:strand:- start:1116 stop:1475 length:360 start_codon:yes stop_codon:yes gene_type:complete